VYRPRSRQRTWLVSPPDYYPELGYKQTLGKLVLEIIQRSRPETTLVDCSTQVYSASFRRDHRLADLSTSGLQRNFRCALSLRGVGMATHDTASLNELALIVEHWLLNQLGLREIRQRIPNFEMCEVALETEAGRGVEARWNYLLSIPCDPDPLVAGWLSPEFCALVTAAARRPVLRQLVPLVCLSQLLIFSRTIGHPYAMACDYAIFASDNRHGVQKRDGTLIAEGAIELMLDIYERQLPPGIGPAIFGTAADLVP